MAESQQGQAGIELGDQLDITVASVMKQRFSGALANEQPIEIDGASLERVDTAGIQLLVAFSRAAAEGPGWTWRGGEVPTKVAQVARPLGLEDEIRGYSA